MFKGGFDPRRFLSRHWQRKPLLIRNALPGFRDPLTPEELAGLACESCVESRLVSHVQDDWRMRNGPFRERDFLKLPERDWTLLVQSVDQWVPEVRKLLQHVDFLPSWRIDDVMVSYAAPGGGVGPHFDYYDVFLVQGLGSRVWQTGQHCTAADELRTDSGLKLLRHFEAHAEYTLHPGDVLYVPPGIAHWGTAVDDSLCYSLGFRAPSVADMLLDFSVQQASGQPADLRYSDPRLDPAPAAGEVLPAASDRAWRLLRTALDDREAFATWFAASMTELRNPEQLVPAQRVGAAPAAKGTYRLHPAARLAWRVAERGLQVHSCGETQHWPDSTALRRLVQALAQPGAAVPAAAFLRNASCKALWRWLRLQGSLERA